MRRPPLFIPLGISDSQPTIHEFLEARAMDLALANDLHRAAALQELVEVHAEGLGIRTDLRFPRRWPLPRRRRDILRGFGPVCVFCAEKAGPNLRASGYPCPVLLGAAEEFSGHPDRQPDWVLNWTDWG